MSLSGSHARSPNGVGDDSEGGEQKGNLAIVEDFGISVLSLIKVPKRTHFNMAVDSHKKVPD